MSKQKEPREFWIELNPSFIGTYNSDLRKYDAYNRLMQQRVIPQIHVIDMKAYDDLKAENEKLISDNDTLSEKLNKSSTYLKGLLITTSHYDDCASLFDEEDECTCGVDSYNDEVSKFIASIV